MNILSTSKPSPALDFQFSHELCEQNNFTTLSLGRIRSVYQTSMLSDTFYRLAIKHLMADWYNKPLNESEERWPMGLNPELVRVLTARCQHSDLVPM